jgi:maltose O-acetyltransferase
MGAVFLYLANALPMVGCLDKARILLLRLSGMRINRQCRIWGPITVRPLSAARSIKIGRGVFINSEVRFGGKAGVTIGNDVLVGPRVMFETTNHGLSHVPGGGRGLSGKEIIIEDEVWIGAGVIITPGVTVGRGAVIAAGAVVTRDVAPCNLVGGGPARLIRTITQS